MKIAVPRERAEGERRVAVVPDTIARLEGEGYDFAIEAGAGAPAHFADAQYREAGAAIVEDVRALYRDADVVIKVRAPGRDDAAALDEMDLPDEGAVLIGLLDPFGSPARVRSLAERRVTAFAMELIPRISRAQKMDALSSQATVAGYRAALIAASRLPKFFPMLMTAAGTIAPARVLVLGAGVAGLQAIATSRRLGAVVQAFDIRPAVKEEVESLGATFLEMDLAEEAEDAGGYAKEVTEDARAREQEFLHRHIREADVVITTAAVPGKPAPVLIEEPMVRDMRPGSVIVDIAAETGGNCALTEPGAAVVRHGVTIHGPLNLPSTMATHASQMYSRNATAFLAALVRDGSLQLDFDDQVVRESCVTHEGEIVNDRVRAALA